jgi:hypothetical protein
MAKRGTLLTGLYSVDAKPSVTTELHVVQKVEEFWIWMQDDQGS